MKRKIHARIDEQVQGNLHPVIFISTFFFNLNFSFPETPFFFAHHFMLMGGEDNLQPESLTPPPPVMFRSNLRNPKTDVKCNAMITANIV